jgi:ABC-2 type transport system ATP-binding protein
MHRPDLMVLDEPTSGLDPLVQEEVVRILEDAAAEGRTVFFSSHVLSEVEKICQSVAIVREGEIVAVEDVANLKSRNVHVVEVTFASAPPPRLFDIPGVSVLRHDGATVRLQSQDAIDAVLKAVATQTVIDLRTEQPNLEDVFLAYYTGNGSTPSAEEQQEVRRASA